MKIPGLNSIEKRWRERRFKDFRVWEWLIDRAHLSIQRGNVIELSKFVDRMAILYSHMIQKDTSRFIANGLREKQRGETKAEAEERNGKPTDSA